MDRRRKPLIAVLRRVARPLQSPLCRRRARGAIQRKGACIVCSRHGCEVFNDNVTPHRSNSRGGATRHGNQRCSGLHRDEEAGATESRLSQVRPRSARLRSRLGGGELATEESIADLMAVGRWENEGGGLAIWRKSLSGAGPMDLSKYRAGRRGPPQTRGFTHEDRPSQWRHHASDRSPRARHART